MAHIKIDKKIASTGYRSRRRRTRQPRQGPPKTQDNVIWMHEKLERPRC
jgi:hypothetical protein